jgi:hypothetical protein
MFEPRKTWLRMPFHRRTQPAVRPEAIHEMWNEKTGGDFILSPELADAPVLTVEPEYELVLPTPVKHTWWAHFFGRTKEPKK